MDAISRDAKHVILHRQGNFHSRFHDVRDGLFLTHPFFDPRDLLQVKYEMLRRERVEGMSIVAATTLFGLSRPAFYRARALYQRYGLAGLVRHGPGPRRCHKLRDEVVDYLQQQRDRQPTVSASALSTQLRSTFGLNVHPRSIERARVRPGKKTPSH